jgi:endonuclease III
MGKHGSVAPRVYNPSVNDRDLDTRMARVLDRLADDYGLPDPRRARTVVDCLIATILSQNTSRANSTAGFDRLKRRFDSWDAVADAAPGPIAAAIEVSGLSKIKAPRIRKILRSIRDQRGAIDLEFLSNLSPPEARDYLLGFGGIGPKTAYCVLLFGLGMDVFPVDTHIHRIARRLGWIDAKASAEKAHDLLAPHVPPGRGFDLHVLLIQHGRVTCKARNPRCGLCCLRDLCPFYRQHVGRES